jgi:predicted nucleic acid-binding protein
MTELTRIYVDTNVLIEFVERTSERWWALGGLFRAAGAQRVEVITSELSFSEVLVKPMAESDHDRISAYTAMLANGDFPLEPVPVSRAVLLRAAAIRAGRLSLKLPDAIHLATAIEMECEVFCSNDRRIRSPSVEAQSDTVSLRFVGTTASELEELSGGSAR